MSLLCRMMVANIKPVSEKASITLTSDKILSSRQYDMDMATLVLNYGKTREWGEMNDKQKVILALRLTYAAHYFAGLADRGNERIFCESEAFMAIASLITDRWHRLAGLWVLMNCDLTEELGLKFSRPAYRKPSPKLEALFRDFVAREESE